MVLQTAEKRFQAVILSAFAVILSSFAVILSAFAVILSSFAVILSSFAVILSAFAVILRPSLVIPIPSLVILSGAKNLGSSLRVNSAKNLALSIFNTMRDPPFALLRTACGSSG